VRSEWFSPGSVLSAAEREKLGAILDKLRQGLIADLSRKGNGKA